MQLGLTEANIRVELLGWDVAIAKLERELGPISDTLKVGPLRRNLSPTTQHYLILILDLLQDFDRMTELVIECGRFNNFTAVRPSSAIISTSDPIDIEAALTGNERMESKTWNGPSTGKWDPTDCKRTYTYSNNYKGQKGNFKGNQEGKTTSYPPHQMWIWTNGI